MMQEISHVIASTADFSEFLACCMYHAVSHVASKFFVVDPHSERSDARNLLGRLYVCIHRAVPNVGAHQKR